MTAQSPVIEREAPAVTLLSVNVAQPTQIGLRHGQPVISGIKKRPVGDDRARSVSLTQLEGDGQADLYNHGGPNKAIYAYPSEHLPLWNAELRPDTPYGPGTFGENLTVGGWLESDVRIGDIWAWGSARLQVSQPRYPCYKLAMTTGRPIVGKRMLETLRNGWYLRVLQPGEASPNDPITVIERGSADATVQDAVRALLPDTPRALSERIAAVPELAPSWREMIQEKLAHDPM